MAFKGKTFQQFILDERGKVVEYPVMTDIDP